MSFEFRGLGLGGSGCFLALKGFGLGEFRVCLGDRALQKVSSDTAPATVS